MNADEIRAVLSEIRAFENAHRLQGEGGNRSETEMADRLKRWGDAFAALLPVPDGDARERLTEIIGKHVALYRSRTVEGDFVDVGGLYCTFCEWEHGPINGYRPWVLWWKHIADAILAAFPVLSRDIAGEIETEACDVPVLGEYKRGYQAGLGRAAEIVRNGSWA